MSVPATAKNTGNPEPHEHQVREGVDDLGGIFGGIVILGERGALA